jgi:hypothetical protein
MDINTLEEKLGIANLSDAEKLALVKGIESNVQASKAAVKAQEAGQYASLVVDAIKRIKNDLETRFNELNGIIDVKAKTLQDGKDGLQGAKGEKGDRGFDGTNGKDGYNGKDGIDGVDGKDGVGVQDAYIDFDGSLIIKLTDGTEINVGEVVPMDVAEKIKVIGNGGGTSQSVLDSLESLQEQINTLTGIDGELGTMAQQDDTSVDINGGAIDGTTIGATTAAAGTFTALSTGTLTATGQTSLGGDVVITNTPLIFKNASNNEAFRINTSGANYWQVFGATTPVLRTNGGATSAKIGMGGAFPLSFVTNSIGTEAEQFRIAHTASAVNYVQVTGAATGSDPAISAQGSDTTIDIRLAAKGTNSNVDLGASNTTWFRVRGVSGGNVVNYLQAQGTTTTNAPVFSAQGTDTNISQVFQSKGTGAIDLAAGSSGVNISNGGTVTALTLTNSGSLYNPSGPTVSISAPTTAGGVQAVATVTNMNTSGTPTVISGGTGYTNGDTLTIAGTGATLTVTGVSGGVITSVASGNFFPVPLASIPANPASVTGGTGSGATFTILWKPLSLTIATAGSGYVEQPTVTFSGGGGSGAAAYATVGSGTVVRSLGSTMSFHSPNGETFRVADNGTLGGAFWSALSGSNFSELRAANASSVAIVSNASAAPISFRTSISLEQFRVSHTASAVNYVQITGAATTNDAKISAQGSDASIGMSYSSKNGFFHRFWTNNFADQQFAVLHAASSANYATAKGSATGAAPVFGVAGTDTNIDLTLTPKGTGNVRFGTYTADMTLVVQGYITIKDSGGTVRKLAVIA